MNLSDMVIVFSHGFGVRKDSRGFFDDISNQLISSGVQIVQFDYNEYNSETNELYAISFQEQALKLQHELDVVLLKNPKSKIIIIGHSQGCLIPNLCNLKNISGVILLAPGFYKSRNEESARKTFLKIPGSTLDFNGISVRIRTDGSRTIIPKEYRKDYFETNSIDNYNNLSTLCDVFIIIAKQDKEVTSDEINELKNSFICTLDGDHEFTGESRLFVIQKIKQIIGYLTY